MTTAVALLRPESVRGRLLRVEVSVRDNRGREEEKAKSHEENRPGGFSLGRSSVNGVQADWEKYEMDTWEGKGLFFIS